MTGEEIRPANPRGRLAAVASRFVRAPLVHFALGGGLMFLLAGGRPPLANAPAGERAPIVLGSPELERLREAWRAAYGPSLDAAEEEALLATAIDDEVLFREALARGLDRGNRALKARLAELGRSFGLATGADAEALEVAARRLGIGADDPVVRRHLIELMRLAVNRAAGAPPGEAELRRYYEEHRDELAAPPRVRFTHVFTGSEPRGERARRDTDELLLALRREEVQPAAAAARGDAFHAAPGEVAATRTRIERLFGAQFAAALDSAPERAWAGPFPSVYGWHLVWVHERVPARLPPFEAVRAEVARRFDRSERPRRVAEVMRKLREKYEVVVAEAGRGGR